MDKEIEKLTKRMIKRLDKHDIHTLFDTYDSWKNIPFIYWIKLEHNMWDIRIVIKIINEQLNMTNLTNPYPIFPSNPFNRNRFTVEEILKIKEQIKHLDLSLDEPIDTFLKIKKKNLTKIYDIEDNQILSMALVEVFSKHLRFKTLNYKDSQDCYIGRWVDKIEPLSEFEIKYNLLKTMPYQIPITTYGMDLYLQIIDNPERMILQNEIDNFPKEYI